MRSVTPREAPKQANGGTALADRDAVMVIRYVVEGASLRDVADEVGLSPEGVRRRLRRLGVDAALVRVVRRAARVAGELRSDGRLESHACAVCGGPVWRPKRVTCSPACAEAWPVLRYHTAEGRERHRLANARSVVKHAGRRKASAVKWAARYLKDPMGTPPNRNYIVKGSRADQAARRVGFSPDPVDTDTGRDSSGTAAGRGDAA